MTRSWLAALLLLTASGTAASAQELQWQPAPPLPALPENNAANTIVAKPLVWEPVTPSDSTPSSTSMVVMPETNPTISANASLVWEPVDSESVIVAEEVTTPPPGDNSAEQAITTARAAIEQKAATFANDRALWRNERWYPQISSDVPVGFGPMGVMTTFALNAIDCTASGVCEGTSDWNNYLDQIERSGEAQYNLSLGVGDAYKLLGLTFTTRIEETKLPFGERNTGDKPTDANLFDEYYIGVHLSRNLSPDTAVKIGIDNWIDIKQCGDRCGFPKSAYGVISQRIRIKENQKAWFSNAYLTGGIGNGQFRPYGEQVRDSIAKQREAGCTTFGYTAAKDCSDDTRFRAIQDASSFGQFYPIGSLAVEAFPGFNIISEWSGRNLNAGFSLTPFKNLGLVLGAFWENILPNCDYGCVISIPDLPGGLNIGRFEAAMTERARFSVQASIEFKF